MVGCTAETSCAVSAAAQFSPAVDFADLDGNLLIANDRFKGMEVVKVKSHSTICGLALLNCKTMKRLIYLAAFLFVAGCAPKPAPVTDAWEQERMERIKLDFCMSESQVKRVYS